VSLSASHAMLVPGPRCLHVLTYSLLSSWVVCGGLPAVWLAES